MREGLGKGNQAFTLIEVVISASLMSIILVSAYVCLNGAMASQRLIEPRLGVLQNGRVALALMAADLRAACPLSKDTEFQGMRRMMGQIDADNLDFGTHNYTPRGPSEGDFCQVSYFLEPDSETGQFTLWRRRNPRLGLDPFTGGTREEIAEGVAGLRFEYYDGFDWYDTWGEVGRRSRAQAQSSLRDRSNLYGLPEAVRITLWLDANPRAKSARTTGQHAAIPSPAMPTRPETANEPPPQPDLAKKKVTEPPLVFQTVARLNLAARSASGGSGGGNLDGPQTPSPATGVN